MAGPLRRTRGFTLVEMMVSLVIGLAVAGALLAAYLTTFQGGRHTDAMAQITEDATLALAVMRQQIAQAGFSTAHAVGGRLRLHAFPPVLGCAAANFRDLDAGMLATPACNTSAAGTPGGIAPVPDALEIAYESGVQAGAASNAILGGSSGGEPLDCLGNTFSKTSDAVAGDYWLADSKFYVADGSLYCHGPGNAAGAALAQNIETLQVRYGMSAEAAGQVAYYDVAPPIVSPAWARVVAVSLCVQARSAAKVLDAAAAATLGSYVDCGNRTRNVDDGYLRRTFSTTIALQNSLP